MAYSSNTEVTEKARIQEISELTARIVELEVCHKTNTTSDVREE